VTIITGDPSFIVDGAPVARAGDMTSCGSKLIASQQAFSESGFDVGSIEPLQSAKSDMSNSFVEGNEADIEGSLIAGNTYVGDPDQGGGGGDTSINSSEIDKTIEGLRRGEFRKASQGFSTPSSTPYNPGRAWDDDKLARTTRVFGEQSETGKQTINGLENSGGLTNYRAEQAQIVKNRAQNIAVASQIQVGQQLDITNGLPPSLGEGLDYENPMAKIRDKWKGELADGGEKTGTALYEASKDAHAGFNAIATTGENLLNKNVTGLKDQAIDKATDTGKNTLIDKAKDFAPKQVRNAWNAYDDYNAVKEKGKEIKDAIPKDD
jgi:hypothetical protein